MPFQPTAVNLPSNSSRKKAVSSGEIVEGEDGSVETVEGRGVAMGWLGCKVCRRRKRSAAELLEEAKEGGRGEERPDSCRTWLISSEIPSR
eukprot:750385-Rhodomonas_salina.1